MLYEPNKLKNFNFNFATAPHPIGWLFAVLMAEKNVSFR